MMMSHCLISNEAKGVCIATYHPNETVTINLKGPIIFNQQTGEARQIVPLNAPVNYRSVIPWETNPHLLKKKITPCWSYRENRKKAL